MEKSDLPALTSSAPFQKDGHVSMIARPSLENLKAGVTRPVVDNDIFKL